MKQRYLSRWGTAAGISLLGHGLFFLALAGLLSIWPVEPPEEPILTVDLVDAGGGGGSASGQSGGETASLSVPASEASLPVPSAVHPAGGEALPVSGAPAAMSEGNGAGAGGGHGAGGTGEGEGSGKGNGSGPSAGETAGTIEAPRILSAPEPVYPEAARRRGLEGTAVVGLLIGEDGSARETWIEASSGDGLLDEAAEEAVRSWQFVPARRDGLPVSARSRVPVVFQLRRN